LPTIICSDEESKFLAIRDKILHLHEAGRPVLVGSRSVAKSEKLSELLVQSGIEHQVLNARHEAKEAAIVALAGQAGVVTISTSMAGRGTDIKLGENVEERGGLHVIIAELNDSQRVDRQLIGRCARQGDRGSYQLFLSPEDHVLDPKHRVELWAWLARRLPLEWFYRRAQARVNGKNVRDRLAMLHHEKKRLRSLRQAGLDPVLDVVG
jgi:preprotein translocase subunit SecA